MTSVSAGINDQTPARAAAGRDFVWLALLGATLMALVLTTPFVFRNGGDNAFMAMAIASGLVAIAATLVGERSVSAKTLWLVLGVAVLLRIALLVMEPMLSSDIYRYIWDGK